jgi:hypothetical protein
MELFDWLSGLLSNEEQAAAFSQNPEGALTQANLGDVTVADVEQEMPRVLNALTGAQSGVSQGGAVDFGGSGNVVLPPAPTPPPGGYSSPAEAIQSYTEVYNEVVQTSIQNNQTTIDDRDTTVDNSVNTQATSFGDGDIDLDQTIDNTTVSGDDNVLAGDGSQVQTGDGIQVGGDVTDSNVIGGDVSGSNLGTMGDGAVVGDGNQVVNAEGDVGAVAFGEGDATNVGGDLISGNEGPVNTGAGDQTTVSDSTVSESQIGSDGSSLSSDDTSTNIEGNEGPVAFGDGSTATDDDTYTSIEADDSNVQVAGEDAAQTGVVDQSDNSTNVADSYNIEDSGNYDLDTTTTTELNYDLDVDASVSDSGNLTDSNDDFSVQDNDAIDQSQDIIEGGV